MGTFRQGLIAVLFAATTVLLVGPAAADDEDTCSKASGDVAIAACTRAITSGNYGGNNLAQLFYNRGIEYRAKGDFLRAIQDYDQAIRLNPQLANAFITRGNAYLDKKDTDRAVQDFDQAIRLNPQFALAFNNRGYVYYYKGHYDRAIEDYDQAIRLNPNHWLALRNRGNAYFLAGNYDKAITDYDAAGRIDPKAADGLYGRGMAKLKKGDEAGGNADIAAAKVIETDIAKQFAKYGIRLDDSTASTAPATTAAVAGCAAAETHWKSAETLGILAGYEDHLARFPNCAFATLAKVKIEALKK